jgi:hypothetical protein
MMSRYPARSRVLAAVAFALCVPACAVRTTGSPPVMLVPVSSGAPKLPLSGLIDMQDISWHNTDAGRPMFVIGNVQQFPGLFGGIVINATWAQMQASAGGGVDFSQVDNALAMVRTYNVANAQAPLGVKLRIYNGNSAPQWAKQLPGGPVTIYRNKAGCRELVDTCPLTIGPFWTAPYIAAWRAFQAAVAAKYDGEPLIRAVAVTSCASQTDEPFVPTAGPVSIANLRSANYSDMAEQACLSGALADYATWKLTGIDYTFNTYTNFSGGGTNPAFAVGVMQACIDPVKGVGTRCILDNHALEMPLYSPDAMIYAEMSSAAGAVVNFQTQAPAGMGCLWRDTIAQGVAVGARAIEVWPNNDGFTTLNATQIGELAREFSSPIPVSGATPGPCPGFY